MRTNRTLVLGAALLALVVSACAPGEGGSPAASAATSAGSSDAAGARCASTSPTWRQDSTAWSA